MFAIVGAAARTRGAHGIRCCLCHEMRWNRRRRGAPDEVYHGSNEPILKEYGYE